ncbi:MAG TPA: SDR family NAD(P)-dependent oxidoreductase [Thermoanaerobaculia bacterium]|nr:SDR family NAD(P)-dependent oxidoreductase [Thermoanaerobaculia bacterium]
MPIPEFQDVPVVVTGGAGFIGSHLVDALVERGAKVTVLDDLSNGFETNLAQVRDRIRFLRGDIRDPEACREAIEGSRYVFHQAARGSVPRSMAEPVPTIDINVRGTATVFDVCRHAKVSAVVYASSSSVYGDSAALPKREGAEGRPLSPYAWSKVASEQLADVFSRSFGMKLLGLRYFNVFGPRQDPSGPYAAVVPRFVAAFRGGTAPVIYGDGEQSRDFTYVSDVVLANLLAAGAPEPAWGHAYNVAPGQATTVNQLARAVREACGGGPEPRYEPPRRGDVLHSLADSSAARKGLGFEAQVSLAAGIERVVGSAR